jgi:hypothetical protein
MQKVGSDAEIEPDLSRDLRAVHPPDLLMMSPPEETEL